MSITGWNANVVVVIHLSRADLEKDEDKQRNEARQLADGAITGAGTAETDIPCPDPDGWKFEELYFNSYDEIRVSYTA